MSNAVEHANQLAQNAMALKDQINSAKEPAKQTLEAANAYSNIADSVNAAIESSNAALAKADELTQVVRKHTVFPQIVSAAKFRLLGKKFAATIWIFYNF